jgi:predicted phosphodiesterase
MSERRNPGMESGAKAVSSATVSSDAAADIVVDLLRSGWIIERARAEVYRRWATADDGRWGDSRERAAARAAVVERSLEKVSRGPDPDLVDPHAGWITNLVGERSDGEPLGPIFMTRIGDWVEAHVSPFLVEGADELAKLGAIERETIPFPNELPVAPPFEPLGTIDVAPPGPMLFRFGILGDLHFGSRGGRRLATAAINDLNESGAELVIQLGDLTDRGNREEFESARDALSRLTMPCTTMMGNHDVFSYKEERLAGREYYPATFGREPDGVLLEHKGVRFAVLDSAEHGTSPFGPFSLVTGTFSEGQGGAIVRGSLTPAQHDILADVAVPGSGPAFIFLHHPPQPFTGFPPVLFGLRDEDSGRLHATCDSGNVWGVFAGHTHRNARTRSFGRVPAQEVAIPRDYPFGYALVDVAATGYAYRFVQISNKELLAKASARASAIHRRYARGTDHERGFTWTTTH